MTAAVIAFTRRGAALGKTLAEGLNASLHVPARFAGEVGAEAYDSLADWTARRMARSMARAAMAPTTLMSPGTSPRERA